MASQCGLVSVILNKTPYWIAIWMRELLAIDQGNYDLFCYDTLILFHDQLNKCNKSPEFNKFLVVNSWTQKAYNKIK